VKEFVLNDAHEFVFKKTTPSCREALELKPMVTHDVPNEILVLVVSELCRWGVVVRIVKHKALYSKSVTVF